MPHRPLAIVALLCAAVLAPLASAATNTYSVSGDIYTYLHTGPGTKFRILGSVKAGMPVSLTGQKQGDYVQIIDDKKRTGWVLSNHLTQDESFRLAVPRLNGEVATLKQQLEQQQAHSDQLQDQVAQLSSQLQNSQTTAQNTEAELRSTLDSLTADNERLRAENQEMQNSERWQWLRQGGMVAGAGLILGLIIAYLPRPQRRRNNRSGWV